LVGIDAFISDKLSGMWNDFLVVTDGWRVGAPPCTSSADSAIRSVTKGSPKTAIVGHISNLTVPHRDFNLITSKSLIASNQRKRV